MTNENVEIGGINTERLCSLISRIEHLEEEKKGIQGDIKDIYAEAKSAGFDTKIMKTIVKLRKMNAADRDQEEAVLDLYKKAVGL